MPRPSRTGVPLCGPAHARLSFSLTSVLKNLNLSGPFPQDFGVNQGPEVTVGRMLCFVLRFLHPQPPLLQEARTSAGRRPSVAGIRTLLCLVTLRWRMPSLRHRRSPWPSSVVCRPLIGGSPVPSMWLLAPDRDPSQLAGPPSWGLPGEPTLLSEDCGYLTGFAARGA